MHLKITFPGRGGACLQGRPGLSPFAAKRGSPQTRPFLSFLPRPSQALVLACLLAVLAWPTWADSAPKQTPQARVWLLAIGCCAPYLSPPPAWCAQSATAFSSALTEALRLPKARVRLLLNSQATRAAVLEGLDWLAKSAGPEDDVIIFYNGHGVLLRDVDPSSRHEMAEVFCLWTPEEPFSNLYAVASGQWLIDHEFARFTSRIKTKRRILLIDACHANAAERALFAQDETHDYNDPNLVLLAAATARQVSFFDPARGQGVFTANLVEAIGQGASTLREAFEKAKAATMAQAPGHCLRLSLSPCLGQTPTLVDPEDLAGRIMFSR